MQFIPDENHMSWDNLLRLNKWCRPDMIFNAVSKTIDKRERWWLQLFPDNFLNIQWNEFSHRKPLTDEASDEAIIWILLLQNNLSGLNSVLNYPHNPNFHMGCDIVLHQNPHRQKTRKKTNFQLWPKCRQKGRMCPTRKLINQMDESRSPTKCEFQQFKLRFRMIVRIRH